MIGQSQNLIRLSDAYRRGYEIKYAGRNNPPEMKLHYFKVKEDLPRVQAALGFLHGIVAAGQCNSLLDIGSGRGVFLFPLLRDFPELDVTSIDILPHRVELLDCIRLGGVSNLHPRLADICDSDIPDKSFDIVTMLEVLEHIPDTEKAVRNVVRVARNYVILSVPSKPDDNPEHIHLFSAEDLTNHFMKAGCSKVKFMSVTGHRIMIAYL